MRKKYKIIADENMPGIQSLFSEIAEIKYVNGREITDSMLSDVDALICRSVTKVDAALLKNTPIKFVGTATIGIDHLDTKWLDENSIGWSNAAGCNAAAVGQYVLSAIAYWCLKNDRSIFELSVGIVGAGNVGSTLVKYLDFYGIKYKLCDPPLQDAGDTRLLTDLNEILKCDVITLHVPITKVKNHPTHHFFSKTILKKLSEQQLLINASRGAVINNNDLEKYLSQTKSASCILDVFEGEPNVSNALVNQCLLATPHIAGHTLEGKMRGSWMIYRAFCQHFGLPLSHQEEELYPKQNQLDEFSSRLEENLLNIYDIQLNSNDFKGLKSEQRAIGFEALRQNATRLPNKESNQELIRRDYSGWDVLPNKDNFTLP